MVEEKVLSTLQITKDELDKSYQSFASTKAESILLTQVGLQGNEKKDVQPPNFSKLKFHDMFRDLKKRQERLMQNEENGELGHFEKVIKFAEMQDEFYFRWGVECEELQGGIEYYINQGETEVSELLKDYSDFFIGQVQKE